MAHTLSTASAMASSNCATQQRNTQTSATRKLDESCALEVRRADSVSAIAPMPGEARGMAAKIVIERATP